MSTDFTQDYREGRITLDEWIEKRNAEAKAMFQHRLVKAYQETQQDWDEMEQEYEDMAHRVSYLG